MDVSNIKPINYEGVADVVRKRCEQIGITESQLLAMLPTNTLDEALRDLESTYIIGQVLNYHLDSMYDCDLPMSKEKLDEMKEKIKPYIANSDLQEVYDMLVRHAERMGEKAFAKMIGKVQDRIGEDL